MVSVATPPSSLRKVSPNKKKLANNISLTTPNDPHTYRLIKLNAMKASQELDNDEKRQLEFDLDSTYSAFMAWLNSQ